MKKMLVVIGLFLALSGAGLAVYRTFIHKPVYGIILLDYDKQKINNRMSHLNSSIKKVEVEGKWQEEQQALILSRRSAQQLTKLNVLNKVTLAKEEYSFEPVKQLAAGPLLFTKDASVSIKNDSGEEIKPKQTDYVVLGDSSMSVQHILITDAKDYQAFQNTPSIYLTAFESPKDASKELINYADLKIQQIYDPDIK